MAANVTLLCGPARTGKTDQLLARYRQQLATGQPGSALWIAPTQRSTRYIRERLLDASLPACFSPGVSTFDGFAELVLAAAPQEIRPISSQIRRRIIARLLQRSAAAGELSYFAPIAETDGLVDLVTGWISELKRLEVWPEHFATACKKRGTAAKDKELVALYQAYQEVLASHQLYDHEGRFWTARELLQSGQWRPLDHLQLVVVDGFTDFTRTQYEILELLAQQAQELWITLPLEADSKRPDLFAKTVKTRDELQRRFHKATLQEVARRKKSDWPTLDHIERQLFSSPQDAVPLKKSDRVEILAASRRLGEIEQVGRRVKELLVEEQVKPGDIAVVFRSLSESAPMVREVFRELGVPFYLDAEETLLASPALKALASMLSLHVEDWPFRSLLGLLSNNYFAPQWKEFRNGEGTVVAELLVRSLQVPSEREALLRQARSRFEHYRNLAGLPEVSGSSTNEEPSDEELARFDSANNAFQELQADDDYAQEEETYSSMESTEPGVIAQESVSSESVHGAAQRASETHAGLALLERLAEAFDELPPKATLVEWGQGLHRLAESLGLLRVVASDPPDGSGTGIDTTDVAEIDRLACEQLFAVLAGGDRLSTWLSEKPPELDASEFHSELLDLLQTEPLPRNRNETGCVRILAAGSARTLEIPYLFLAGLTERSFPQPERDGLYTETEARTLISAGVPLVDRLERNQEELLLFYEVVTRPSKRLILSYPALDEKAQPLSPSSYLLEVERACGAGVIPRWEEPDLSPVPRGTKPLGFVDQRLIALDQLLKGEPAPLARLLTHPPRADFPPQLLASLAATHARQRGDSFGAFEGVLSSPAAAKVLAAQFGPSYTWSASRLETYAYCPFRYFAGDVLGVQPLDELALEVDYGARGALLHAALSHIHRQLNLLAERASTPAELEVEEFIRQLDEALVAMIAIRRAASRLEEAQREVDRRTLARWGKQYHEQHTDYDAAYAQHELPLRPSHFEVRFGPRRRDAEEEDPLSTDEPFELKMGEEILRLTGRIDRIDRGVIDGQPVFNVLDYKSGRSAKLTAADIEAGIALQLPLYTMAAHELLLREYGDVPWQAGYWIVRERGFNQKQALVFYEQQAELLQPSEAWKSLREKVLERVAAIVAGVRSGEFPMFSVDDTCTSRCEFRTVCRVNQTRSLEKVWPAPVEVEAK